MEDQGAPSPFLPGTMTQFAWDSTSLGYLKTCPRLYQYHMIEGWRTKEESVHLRFGIEYHQALRDYDILRVTKDCGHSDALNQVVRELLVRTTDFSPDPDTKPGKYKSRHNLVRTVINYLDKFQSDPTKTVVLPNGRPAVELSFRFELDWGPGSYFEKIADVVSDEGQKVGEGYKSVEQPYLLCGHLDRVVDFNGTIMGMDRKTTTMALGEYYFAQFEPNNQMSLYTLAAKVILSSPIKGMIIDAAQLLIEESRFERSITYRTPDQTEEWLGDLRFWLFQAERYATEGYWPMNDTACDKFGGCAFRKVCTKSPQVREKFLESSFIKLKEDEKWNPLVVR